MNFISNDEEKLIKDKILKICDAKGTNINMINVCIEIIREALIREGEEKRLSDEAFEKLIDRTIHLIELVKYA